MSATVKKKTPENKLPAHVLARIEEREKRRAAEKKREREIDIAWEQHNKWRAEQPE